MPGPLDAVEQWDDFVAARYRPHKAKEEFRNYRVDANPVVTGFYRQNHANQTLSSVLAKKAEFGPAAARAWASGRRWNTSTRRLATATPLPT